MAKAKQPTVLEAIRASRPRLAPTEIWDVNIVGPISSDDPLEIFALIQKTRNSSPEWYSLIPTQWKVVKSK